MIIKFLSFEDLELYQKIPMFKSGSYIYVLNPDQSFDVKNVEPFSIDLASEEKVSDWIEILNEDSTSIMVIEDNDLWIGGCITVTHSPKVNMLRNNMENAVLWDIRVHPQYQKLGIGSILLESSIQFAKKKECKHLIIETQDNNPTAIDFYVKHGAYLIDVNPNAYHDQPNETQYIFQIDLYKGGKI
ncbi:GNAT family N-acetyltransferase [Peloplasma aerotolerans]|uniref:GNAT family N-acetyltransferase n=1 Tax=Peloplasma aerotolerans TaxID=3044389 RepID=A0AAW6UB07_9MOLU|nr:GNAT family N-acetyltransferase [Mariniplasma sp. M4Ah]MDI6453311.1 GNAT family N-acetyltransferase [Mariniplasma sp. M4Ah]